MRLPIELSEAETQIRDSFFLVHNLDDSVSGVSQHLTGVTKAISIKSTILKAGVKRPFPINIVYAGSMIKRTAIGNPKLPQSSFTRNI